MYHPPCAGMVSSYAGRHPGLSMSVFILGGTLAFGVGPIFITGFVQYFSLDAIPYTMILGLSVMVFLFMTVPDPGRVTFTNLGFLGSIREVLGATWKPIALLWVIMVLRAYVGQSFMTFLPVLYAGEHYSLISIGTMISLFTVGGALSGLLAGHLSDRVGYKPIFFLTHGLSCPSLYFLLVLPGNWVYFNAFVAGFMVLATLPLGVAMGQELAPKGKSMVSSLMMGLAFGTGGLLTPLTGKMGDIFSIRPVLMIIGTIPLLTIALIALLPGKTLKRLPSGQSGSQGGK
jgi:FSR family fosmidomycin resistance protein-like MFS transporter